MTKRVKSLHPLQSTIGNRAVQRLMRPGRSGSQRSNAYIHEAAAHGTQGGGKPLPLLNHLVDKKTKSIEISLVAMYNGFQHDLKAVCDLAHADNAYVYADIIQAAGATPIDVRATGVDFCSCSSFKWLMADFGPGFLYAREDARRSARQNPASTLRLPLCQDNRHTFPPV